MNRQDADKAILRILEKQQGQPPAVCPDANELAAYLEARLSEGETARFEEHAAECVSCREALVLSMKLAAEAEKTTVTPVPEIPKSSYRTSPLRLAFGAALVLIVGVMLFQATRQANLPLEKPQVATLPSRSKISGGPEAALSSADSRKEAPAKPSPAMEVAALPPAERLAQAKDEKALSKPAAAPAPTQFAFEAANTTRPQAVDKIEETRMKALGDLVAEAQKSKRAQPDSRELKVALANQPADAKGQTGQVVGAGNQLPSRSNIVAQTSNQMMTQNAQMAQTSNTANIVTQQMTQADRQVVVDPGRMAQAQGATNQTAAGRAGAGGQQAAIPPMRLSETQKFTVTAAAAKPGVTSHIDKFPDPLSPYYRAIPAFKAADPIIPEEVAGFVKKLGNRVFYRMTGYWLDTECARHPGAAPREIAWNSREFADLLKKEPALAQLRPSGLPILIHWNGTNYLVR